MSVIILDTKNLRHSI